MILTKRILLFLPLFLFYNFLLGQNFTAPSSILYADMLKLGKVGSVLYVAAHPDDENTRLLSYMANNEGLRTGYLSLTRGDGGQNLIGKELGEGLGVIRTQELLAARKVDGARQFFTRAVDFGYSKTPKETLQKWDETTVLSDVVHAFREFKPDLVICRFPTTGEGGHGHHTASAILADSAYVIAGNPAIFPSSAGEFGTWQPATLLWNTFNFGSTNTISEDQLKMEIGGLNELTGRRVGEIAAESRTMHKSQGFGAEILRGEIMEYFKYLKGKMPKKSPLDAFDFSWSRFGSPGTELSKTIQSAISQFDFLQVEKNIPALVAIKAKLKSIKTTDPLFRYYLDIKIGETDQLILKCAGVFVELLSTQPTAVEGEIISTQLNILASNTDKIRVGKIIFPDQKDSTAELNLSKNILIKLAHSLAINKAASLSSPYWLREPADGNIYRISNPNLLGQPQGPALYEAEIQLNIQGDIISVRTPLLYKRVDPTRGDIKQPFYILPAVHLSGAPEHLLFAGSERQELQMQLSSNSANVSGTLVFEMGTGYSVAPASIPFHFASEGETKDITIAITPDIKSKSAKGVLNIYAKLENGAKLYELSQQKIEYDHIPNQLILRKSAINLERITIAIGKKRIAYIPGAGDDVASSLKSIGYDVDIIEAARIPSTELKNYDAIIMGIRAYNVHEDLFGYHDQLMKYISQGGNLIVQYNTNTRVGPLKGEIGPFPFSITRDRVTEEGAKVSFINAAEPALNFPNKISDADFDGWVQERGIYFAGTRDKAYRSVFLMNDQNEKPTDGSLIIAPYGKGNFVYTGLVFFRELPAGVPGAFRLMSNLINLPVNE